MAVPWSDKAVSVFQKIQRGSMSSTAYDTAWFVRLTDDAGRLRFPSTWDWLIGHQHEDGSWGGRVETYYDRTVSTLSAVCALRATGRPEAQPSIRRGREYLARTARCHPSDDYVTIGFELLVPSLLAEARSMGVDLPYAQFDDLGAVGAVKIARDPDGSAYAPGSPLAHNLEHLRVLREPAKARPLLEANGSVANSPSASAFLAQSLDDSRLTQYLRDVMASSPDGGVPNVRPFEIFETAWVLCNFQMSGLVSPEMDAGFVRLGEAWSPAGVGISRTGLAPDADDSAMCFSVLRMAGGAPDLSYLAQYRVEHGYRCFLYERHPSVSTNIHIAESLRGLDGPARDARRHAVDFLRDSRVEGRYWKDKWHASPYYATGHAVLALDEGELDLIGPALDWLIDTQRDDGSWGLFEGTAEETAYGMQALMRGVAYHTRPEPIDAALDRAAEYLSHSWRHGLDYTELWIGKGLYCPTLVVEAAVISALAAHEWQRGYAP